jgi:glycosyltransferase involved in cell wall biosynthesis
MSGPGPIRILELRSVFGTGGGPEKTILLGTARTDPSRYAITVCYLRDARDPVFTIDAWARAVGVPYVEVLERHSFDPAIWTRLRRLVREHRIDIVHAHDYKTDVLALALAWKAGIVPMATVHGWTGHSWKEQRLYYPLDKRALARFPHLVAVSEQIRQELIAHGAPPVRVTTVLNAIDPVAFRRDRRREAATRAGLGLPPDALVLGAVGRVEPQKRFDLLIDAFAGLAASRPRLHLVIAGDGSRRAEIEARRAALGGLAARVHLLGQRSDVADLHHAFDVFVQASDYEGTPNAVLEAMALETPIVATSAGGTAEIAHDGVHAAIVPIGDGAALARAIAGLLDDPPRRRALAAAARARVEGDLSFATRLRHVERVYDLLMEGRPRRAAALP